MCKTCNRIVSFAQCRNDRPDNEGIENQVNPCRRHRQQYGRKILDGGGLNRILGYLLERSGPTVGMAAPRVRGLKLDDQVPILRIGDLAGITTPSERGLTSNKPADDLGEPASMLEHHLDCEGIETVPHPARCSQAPYKNKPPRGRGD
jgi:hypothetical protein